VDWKSHLILGFILGAAVSFPILHASLWQGLLFSAISAASALLPDLDQRRSKASQITYGAGIIAAFAFSLLLTISAGATMLDFLIFFAFAAFLLLLLGALFRPRHRGVMHSLAFLAALCAAAFVLFGAFPAAAIGLGYLSHLLSDFCVKLL
jgi:membrane-bound metal-dependent hydrolase YbcI (DUF457 family)